MDLFKKGWAGPKVLVVDDERVAAKVMKRLFAGHGIEVDVAPNGRVALEMSRTNRYRLVLSDWLMPEMNGVELCKALRARTGPYVYFLLCSSNSDKADRMEAYEAGVDDFLTKPLDPDEFYARLTVARRLLTTEDDLQSKNDTLERTAARLEEMNASLELARGRFEALFDGLPVACFTFDESGRVREWNHIASDFFGLDPRSAVERPIMEQFADSPRSPWNDELVRSVFNGNGVPPFDWVFRRPDGSELHLACVLIALRDREGRAIGAVCANFDVTERALAERRVAEQMEEINHYAERLREVNAKLNELAITDGLTGLWNHRRFQEALDTTVEVARRTGEPFSLLLLDIDHFKRLNDECGHQAGDEALRQFAERLRAACRLHELPARYGGEEFAVILQRADAQAARRVCERLRRAFSSFESAGRRVTVSIGAATSTNDFCARTIVSQADQALYASKRTGRDRYTHFADVDSLRIAA